MEAAQTAVIAGRLKTTASNLNAATNMTTAANLNAAASMTTVPAALTGLSQRDKL